ncbi:urease accessory protein UreF [Citrobacter amalonaticus]|uniref:Urease accessory protein UreF n=2 Tax=Citrobacter amalonaticus TaxID=35703 RepID=A0A2S4RRL0_CITAM|nr:urease accessory protein UreF [Citrobacter amalonaticus]POT58600.1 urease accessory protein UreF [Citrobacter amalonaticus]POT70338.1 urease accessory protein UreF [Citrobacter amalonaticus]POU61322.1 urease accessory protein UreF [Citrobacter amalonaticus]POV05109.1 urease accessory protein UreF [Citrobacter amalonaticus]
MILNIARILQFGDSVLPVGAFTFSCGVESAISCGIVYDRQTLKQYVCTALLQAAKCDAVAQIQAMRSCNNNMPDELIFIDHDVISRKLTAESRLMTQRMGKKLTELSSAIYHAEIFDWWLEQIRLRKVAGTYPVSHALLMNYLKIDEQEMLVMHFYGVAMTLLSAAQRLMRITHLDSQKILAEVSTLFPDYCAIALSTRPEEMSSFSPVIDILAAIHVDAHVRLFMS